MYLEQNENQRHGFMLFARTGGAHATAFTHGGALGWISFNCQ